MQNTNRRVVVTGIGIISPVGCTPDEFWSSISSGVSGIGELTSFDPGDSKFRLAAEVKGFDAAARLDKLTAKKHDSYVLYALAAADEAMQQSGVLGTVEPERIGVYIASGVGGIQTLCREHLAMLEGGMRRVTPQFVSKMIINMAAGVVAIKYKAEGPNMSVSTACASGATAIGEAYKTIKHGYADVMICGGTEAAIIQLTIAGFGNCLALTQSTDPAAAPLPFDRRRAGFGIGEGATVFILEEYERAVARGASIYAEVVGHGATCDAYHVTAPSPDAKAISRAITLAMEECRDVSPSAIYINAHGTGTPLNDKTETLAIKNAFGHDAYKLHISSTKSMTGHMLGAAGAAEAAAAVLALKHGIIPPTINLNEPDPDCDLNYTPNVAVKADLEVALSTSLGFGGHNVCLAFRPVRD